MIARRLAAIRRTARYALVAVIVGTLMLALYPLPGGNSVNLIPLNHKLSTLRCIASGRCLWMLFSRPVLIDWIGNIVAFAPFGAALAMATWPDRRAPGLSWYGRTLLIGMLFSVSIELAQTLVPGRITDIDDVILNTIGVLCGMIVGYAVMRIATRPLDAP